MSECKTKDDDDDDGRNHCYKEDKPDNDKKAGTKKEIRRRGWADGVLIPGVVGCVVAYATKTLSRDTTHTVARYTWYTFAVWQVICGLGVFYDLAPGYLKSSVPQAGKLAELVGAAWLVLAYVTAMAAADGSGGSLVDAVVVGSLFFNALFAVNAGPQRLRDANDEEMMLVPTTAFLVGICAALSRDLAK